MKSKTLLSIFFIFFLTSISFSQPEGNKNKKYYSHIAVIDLDYIFNNTLAKAKAQLLLEKKKSEFLKKVKILEKTIKDMQKKFEAQKGKLSEKDFKRVVLDIELRKKKLTTLIESKNKELKLLEQSLKEPIFKEIFIVIENVRKKEGIEVILNKKDVLAYNNNIDLTQKVMTIIKKKEMLSKN